ncbi:MAG: hypothetical protein V4739_12680 [Pseudomonadota bacterium]
MKPPPPARTIAIHPKAPAKPAWGAPCNGCGVCCLSEPCPIGRVLSRRLRGACVAVRWAPDQRRYTCGVVEAPQRWWPLPWRWTQRLAAHWSRRWIAAGRGCDCDIELQDPGDADDDTPAQRPREG